HIPGRLTAVEIERSGAHHSTAHATAATTTGTASWRTTGRSATCGRTTWPTAGTTTSYLLIDRDLFVGLCDVPGNALGVLQTLIETLALALIKRPGSSEVWRSCMRSQSKHQRACQAKSIKQLSHSRSPYDIRYFVQDGAESTKTRVRKL